MKKFNVLTVLVFFFSMVINAQSFEKELLTVYGGISIIPVKAIDFEDFHISDWENYGLGTSEGRVVVPLASNTPGNSIGLNLGVNYELSEKLSALFEINYSFTGISITQILLGVNYSFVQNETFSLGFVPKLGYSIASASFGAIEVLPNKTPPVILPEGTFYEGDELTMELSGLIAQLGLNANYAISSNIGAFVNLNYGLAFGGSGVLMASGLEIPMTANGVVKDDFTSTQAAIEPNAKIQGLGFTIGITYKLSNW